MPDLGDLVHRIEELEARESDRVRLAEGVERLADETGGLNMILNKVDEQQQRLSTLGRDLQRVEKSKASKEDLAVAKHDQEEQAWEFRKAALKRIYASALFILVFFGLVGGFFYEYQRQSTETSVEVCEARNEQSRVILELLRNLVPLPGNQEPIQESIEKFEALIIDCEAIIQ